MIKINGHDPKVLMFFENIIFDGNQPILENMEKIINIILDPNYKYEFLFMTGKLNEKGFIEYYK